MINPTDHAYDQASNASFSFAFVRDGIAAEGVINMEQVGIADVDLDALAQNRFSPLQHSSHATY